MTFGAMFDYTLAIAQCVLALLMWARAEPRMREHRGPWQGWCMIALGFVLAWSFPLAYIRPLGDDPLDWQRSARDFALLISALCLYRHAMTVGTRTADVP